MDRSRTRAGVALLTGLACIAFVAVILPAEDAEHVNMQLTPKQEAQAKKIGEEAKAPKAVKANFVQKKSVSSSATIARVKKAAKEAAKLTPFQKKCMALKQYAYAAMDLIVELPVGEGGVSTELCKSLVQVASEDKLDPDKIPLKTLTPEACQAQYTAFMKKRTASAEKDSIPYFQLQAIRESMEKGDGILTTFKEGMKVPVVVIDGKRVGLDGTPSGWIEHLGVTQEDISYNWKHILPKKKAEIIKKQREKIVFGQAEFDALFKPYCGEVDIHTNINMGCSGISSPVKCHKTAGCEWQGPWNGDFTFDV